MAIEGDLLVVGASRTSVSWIGQSDGAAYLFRRNATDPDRWDYVARLIVPGADQCVGGLTVSQFFTHATAEELAAAAACARGNSSANDGFGHRVAIDGDTVVVTARFADADDGTFSTGEAHVFQRDPSGADAWPHVATLAPSMPSGGAYFGSALALAGDTVLIGAPGTTIDARQRQGAAYLFERAAGGADAWGEVARLVASDGLSEGSFGSAVALDGSANSSAPRATAPTGAPSTSRDSPSRRKCLPSRRPVSLRTAGSSGLTKELCSGPPKAPWQRRSMLQSG